MTESDVPLFVVVSGTPYHGVRRSARSIADALGTRTRVLFVDPPASFATKRTDLVTDEHGTRGTTVQESSSVFRLAPNAPPGKDRTGIRHITRQMMARQIRSAVARLDAQRWVLFQQSAHHSVLGRIGEQMSFYHASDNLTAGASLLGLDAATLARSEEKAARSADMVLAVSPPLVERWSEIGVRTELFPNAVDASAFADVHTTIPASEVVLPHPVAGVVGALSERLDMALLHAVADRMSLLLVGPENFRTDRSEFEALINRPSVQWVGQVPFESLSSYYRCIDVALVPYTLSEFNQSSCPLKALEYLAAGKQVVSTNLAAIETLEAPGIVFASSPVEFAAAALAQSDVGVSGDAAIPLRAFTTEHTWESRADRLLTLTALVDHAV
jgi:teichuronic acid biosynthesis glycosyltransferase TuaH